MVMVPFPTSIARRLALSTLLGAWGLGSFPSLGWADETFPASTARVVDLDLTREGGLYVATSTTVWIRKGENSDWRALPAPPFRLFDLEVVISEKETEPPLIMVAGGSPGRFGAVAHFDPVQGRWQDRRLGDDVFYDLSVNSKTGQVALAGADQEVWLLDSGKPLAKAASRKIHAHSATVRVVAFSPDGSRLASGGLDGLILLSEAEEDHASPHILQEHTAGVTSLSWSPEGDQLASGSRDGKVRIHQANGRWLRTYSGFGREDPDASAFDPPMEVTALAWDPKQPHALAGSDRGSLYALDANQNTWHRLAPPRSKEPVAALGATGSRLIAGQENRLITLDRNASD